MTSFGDENLPSWLNPSYNKERPDTSEETSAVDNPSWLIPAYQKASSSSSSERHWRQDGVVLVLFLVWMVFVLL